MESPVFVKQDGKPFEPNDLRGQIFYEVLYAAGMRQVRFNDLRHSFASLLLGENEHLVYIKDQLEHSDNRGHLRPPDT